MWFANNSGGLLDTKHTNLTAAFCDSTAAFHPRLTETQKSIGVDFAFRFGFAQNSQKNIAGCDTWTLHPAIAELRKVRRDDFAPCETFMSHLAKSRHHTLRLPRVAPCDSKTPLLDTKSSPPISARSASTAAEAPTGKSPSHSSTSPTTVPFIALSARRCRGAGRISGSSAWSGRLARSCPQP